MGCRLHQADLKETIAAAFYIGVYKWLKTRHMHQLVYVHSLTDT